MNKAQKILAEYKAELRTIDGTVIVISARNIPDSKREQISQELEVDVGRWLVGLKPKTLEDMGQEFHELATQFGVPFKVLNRDIGFKEVEYKIEPYGQEDLSSVDLPTVWGIICKYMSSDGYYLKWSMDPGNWKYDPKIAAEIASHKGLDRVISTQDAQDILILVNTAKDVNDFISSI